MDSIVPFVLEHADAAPWLLFGLLMLAGLNVPISEDAMILTGALIATQRTDLVTEIFVGLYLGAYLSDLECYWLARLLGPKLWQIRWFRSMATPKRVDRMTRFYEKYGVITLFAGRFIPFGVRNGLLITAGISNMSFLRLAAADLGAATISCGFYFWLYYTYGEAMLRYVARGQLSLFIVALVVIVLIAYRARRSRARLG